MWVIQTMINGTAYYRNSRGKWTHTLRAHTDPADILQFDSEDGARAYIKRQRHIGSVDVILWSPA